MKGLIALMLMAVTFVAIQSTMVQPAVAQTEGATFVLELDDNLLAELQRRQGLKSYMPAQQTFSKVSLKYLMDSTSRTTRTPSIFNPATEPAVNKSEPNALAFALTAEEIAALKAGKLLVSELDPNQNIGMIKVVLDNQTTNGTSTPATNASSSTQFGTNNNGGSNSIPSLSTNADNVFGGNQGNNGGNTNSVPPSQNQGGNPSSSFPQNNFPNAFPGDSNASTGTQFGGQNPTGNVANTNGNNTQNFSNNSGFTGPPPTNMQTRTNPNQPNFQNQPNHNGTSSVLNNGSNGQNNQNQVPGNTQQNNSFGNPSGIPSMAGQQYGGSQFGSNPNANSNNDPNSNFSGQPFANSNHLSRVGNPNNMNNGLQPNMNTMGQNNGMQSNMGLQPNNGMQPNIGMQPNNGMQPNQGMQFNQGGNPNWTGPRVANNQWQTPFYQNQPPSNHVNRLAGNQTMLPHSMVTNPLNGNQPVRNNVGDGPLVNQPNKNTSVSNPIDTGKKNDQKEERKEQPVAAMSPGMLMVLWFLFFLSVGLNIYLFMIWKGAYTRYQDLADELRQTFSQGSS